MNNNFTCIKGRFFFLILSIGFITASLISGATGPSVFTGSQSSHSTNRVYEASSSTTTYFSVNPLEVRGIMPSDEFLVRINVTDAPETHTWEFFLSWNSSLLEKIGDEEGDFLSRGVYLTAYTIQQTSAAQVGVTCSIEKNLTWASGDGWLCSLSFRVKALGSCVLNLSETRLWDHIYLGGPAYTYYSNRDGFFTNQPYHDIAVTALTASPTEVKAGGIVTINATVVNEGNYSETFTVAFYADINASKYLYEYFPSEYVFEIRFDRGRLIDVRDDVGNEITAGTQPATTDLGTTTTVTLPWNTTDAEGNYTLSAASLLLDDDTRDNMFIGGIVTINPPAILHDIAITNVAPSPTEVKVGENVDINVTVRNEGSFDETFNVTVYRGDTAIATQTSITLTNGTTTTRTFIWDTTDVPEGTYTISAKVPPLSDEREADKADNTYIDGTVIVRGAPAPDILPYVVAAVAIIIIVVAVAIYIIKFRKPVGRR